MGQRVWEETGGERETQAREVERRRHLMKVWLGLERCPECGGEAKICIFGFDGEGVWVGCDRSPECARGIEYHKEGWSVDDAAERWNKRNRGINWLIRKLKGWFWKRFGRMAREERGWEEKRAAREEAAKERRREVFGIERQKERKGFRRLKKVFNRKRKQKA